MGCPFDPTCDEIGSLASPLTPSWEVNMCTPVRPYQGFLPFTGAFGMVVLLWWVVVSPTWAGEEDDRFALYMACEPIMPIINVDGGEKIGLTPSPIKNAVESRLRSARIHWSARHFLQSEKNPFPFLQTSVLIVGPAYSVSLEFSKRLVDGTYAHSLGELEGYATTWSRSVTGTHGSSANFILTSVAKLMDEFLVDYLRVNEAACAS